MILKESLVCRNTQQDKRKNPAPERAGFFFVFFLTGQKIKYQISYSAHRSIYPGFLNLPDIVFF